MRLNNLNTSKVFASLTRNYNGSAAQGVEDKLSCINTSTATVLVLAYSRRKSKTVNIIQAKVHFKNEQRSVNEFEVWGLKNS